MVCKLLLHVRVSRHPICSKWRQGAVLSDQGSRIACQRSTRGLSRAEVPHDHTDYSLPTIVRADLVHCRRMTRGTESTFLNFRSSPQDSPKATKGHHAAVCQQCLKSRAQRYDALYIRKVTNTVSVSCFSLLHQMSLYAVNNGVSSLFLGSIRLRATVDC